MSIIMAPEVVRTRTIHHVPLTPRGRMEAQAAGRAFSNVALDRAICSGLPRTRETAELVLAQLHRRRSSKPNRNWSKSRAAGPRA